MRRREFLSLSGTITLPAAARAEQARKLPTVGVLGPGTRSNWHDWTAAFVEHLSELGWLDGQTVTIEFRCAEGRAEQFRKIALKVDVIVTVGGAVPATKQALQRSQVGLRADIAPSLRMSIFDPIRTDSAP